MCIDGERDGVCLTVGFFRYYSTVLPASGDSGVAVLDLCSSWISHYPEGFSAGRISGLGMNKEVWCGSLWRTGWCLSALTRNPGLVCCYKS